MTPHLLYVNYPLLLFLGAVIFFFMRELVSEKITYSWKSLLLFVPGILVFVFLFPFFFSSSETKLYLYPLAEHLDSFKAVCFNFIDYCPLPWIGFCFLLSLRYTYFLWNKKAMKEIKNIRKVLIFIVMEIILAIFLSYSDLTGNSVIYKFSLLTSNFLVLVLFFASIKYPEFFFELKKETLKLAQERIRYIGNLNVPMIVEKMEQCMLVDKIYCDYNLTLEKFSKILGITNHQLSEIINKKYRMNFRKYLNGFRIEAVKVLIIDHPTRTILEIALSCGFNSKTTFNTVFTQFEGLTPSQFRKLNK